MPLITSIKPQRKGKRVNIYLDGEFGFGLDLENFVVLGLKAGKTLSEQEISEIIKKAEFQKTLNKLLRFATLRPRSEKEIDNWLKRKKVHQSLYEELLKRLRKLKLLNDKKFAEWWVEQRTAFSPRGRRALDYELRGKGINKEIINEVLESTKIDEKKIAKELLEKYAYKWKNLSLFEAKQKKTQFLARKGFNWEVIKESL